MNIAIIPARGGSKRIPDKNIKLFNGQPVIQYAINAAIESKIFNRIVVTTDSIKIRDFAIKAGADAPFLRNPDLSDDFAGTREVIVDALAQCGIIEKDVAVCCIYPCVPLLTSTDIVKGRELLNRFPNSYILSCKEFAHPISRGFRLEDDRSLVTDNFPSSTRTQDSDSYYHDAGQYYWAMSGTWKSSIEIISSKSKAVILKPWHGLDIDSLADWKLAEIIHRGLHRIDGE